MLFLFLVVAAADAVVVIVVVVVVFWVIFNLPDLALLHQFSVIARYADMSIKDDTNGHSENGIPPSILVISKSQRH